MLPGKIEKEMFLIANGKVFFLKTFNTQICTL